MDELTPRLEAARDHLTPDWEEDRAALVLAQLRHRAARRSRRRAIAAVAASSVVVAALASWWARRDAPAPADDHGMTFADGSRVTTIRGAQVELEEVTLERAVVALHQGTGRFESSAQGGLIVRSGALTLVGPGATYQIQRLADRATVRVERGALRIEWIGGRAELRPGDTATFPTEAPPRPVAAPIPAEAAKEAPPVPPPPATQPQPQPPRAARAAPTPSIGEPPPLVVPADPVGALLAQADAARAAGRSEAAAALLERVGRDHPGDPRTPLAAFTLGRLLLEALDRPAQAAEAFARAWALDPRGALAEDALAREVESLAAAGDREGAKARALEYRRRYPKGSRIRVELE